MINKLISIPQITAPKEPPKNLLESGNSFQALLDQDVVRLGLESKTSAPVDDEQIPVSDISNGTPIGVESRMELVVQRGGDAAELITLPWRLLAGWHMAMMGRASVDGAAELTGPQHLLSSKVESSLKVRSENTLASSQLQRNSHIKTQGLAAAIKEDINDDEGVDHTVTESRIRHLDLAVWQRRFIKLIETQNVGQVLLMRDYILDSNDQLELVQRLRRELAEQGAVVQKVIMNGREIWHTNGVSDHAS